MNIYLLHVVPMVVNGEAQIIESVSVKKMGTHKNGGPIHLWPPNPGYMNSVGGQNHTPPQVDEPTHYGVLMVNNW